MGALLIPTAIQVVVGGSLYLLRKRPIWEQMRQVRYAALMAVFVSLVVYVAAVAGAGASLGWLVTCLTLVLAIHFPIVSQLILLEVSAILPAEVEREAEVAWNWRVRRRLLFGSESRRRRLWARKRRQLPQRSTDPVLRLELLELCIGLGEYGEGIYHAHALDELLPTGETHAFALLRMAQVIAERQQRLAAAQPTLHRLIRLYPVSVHRDEADRLIRLYEEAH